MKTPDFMSYDRYKKKKKTDSKNGMLIFVTTFFATLLVFTVVAKELSPNVDVSIGDDSQTDIKENGLGVKKFIDERLKMIQMEDNSAGVSTKDKNSNGYDDASFNKYSKTVQEVQDSKQTKDIYDEPISLPSSKQNKKQTQDSNAPTATPPRPNSSDAYKPFDAPVPKASGISKVYVGRYSTIDQAKVAQEILIDSGLNYSPFIKNLGGYYTLQIGSYTNRATANAVMTQLQQNSFPARISSE